jgi:hypothetical protein
MTPERLSRTWALLFGGAGVALLALAPDPAVSPNGHFLALGAGVYLLFWAGLLLLRRAALKGFVVASASLALLVGGLEALALAGLDFGRLFDTHRGSLWNHPGNVSDARLFYRREPHSVVDWEGVRYRYDQHGFRNPSDPTAAEVVVIGDSFVEGWNVPAEELVTARLAVLLGREVVNLGQSGYGPQQEFEVLERFGLPLKPRTVVWVFFEGNDPGDAERHEWIQKNWPSLSKPVFRERSFTRGAIQALRRLREKRDEPVPSTLHPGTDALAAQTHRSGLCRHGGRASRLYFWYAGHPLSERDERALDTIAHGLHRASQLCRRTGAKFLVVFTPTKYRVYKDLCAFEKDSLPAGWTLNDLPARFAGMVARAAPDVGYLDLTPTLREEAARGPLLYFDYDTHWTAAGHAVVAREIAREIDEVGL